MERITHQQCHNLLHERDTLSEANQILLDAHLTACLDCQVYARLVKRLNGELPEAVPTAHFSNQEMRQRIVSVQTRIRNDPMKIRIQNFLISLAWISLIVLLVIGLGWAIRNLTLRPTPAGMITPSPTSTLLPSPQVIFGTPALSTQTPFSTPAIPASDYPVISVANATQVIPIAQIAADKSSNGYFSTINFSPDGKWVAVLASFEYPKGIYLYDVQTKQLVKKLTSIVQDYNGDIAFSPDGKVISVGVDSGVTDRMTGSFELWDIESGKLLNEFPKSLERIPNQYPFSPNGRTVVTSQGIGAQFWNVESGQLRFTLEAAIYAFSPDGQKVVGMVGNGIIKVWDTTSGESALEFTTPQMDVTDITFSHDGKMIATAGGRGDGTIRLWDAATGKPIRILTGHTAWLNTISFNPDDSVLASCAQDDTIRLWDTSTGKLLKTLEVDNGMATALAFNLDGTELASVKNWEAKIRFWAVADETQAFPTDIPPTDIPQVENPKTTLDLSQQNPVGGLAWTTDGKILAASAFSGVNLYAMPGLEKLNTLVEGGPFFPLIIDLQGKRLLADDQVWDIATGQLLYRVTSPYFGAAAFSPDGQSLVTAGERGINLWDAGSGKTNKYYQTNNSSRNLAFSPDGNSLLIVSEDWVVQRLELATGQFSEQFTLPGSYGYVFSPDDRRLVVNRGLGYGQELWDVEQGIQVTTYKNCSTDVWFGTFSPDGKYFISGPCLGENGSTVYMWDTNTQQLVHAFGSVEGSGYGSEWRSAAFSPDGKTLAIGNDIGQIWLWDVGTYKLLNTIHILEMPGS
jgi:WD40 repeat protein